MKKLLLLVLNMAAAMSVLSFSTSASAQIGSLSSDLVFYPVTPCRIMDTRNPGVESGILAAGSTRSFIAWGSTFAGQGGVATNCNILQTSDTAAVVLNLTTVTPDAAGFITAFPDDAVQPVTSTVNFTAGSVIGNNATLKINQTGVGADFKVFSTANVHLVADVVGYYAKPVKTALTCSTVIASRSLAIGFDSWNFATAVCPAGTIAVSPYCWNNDANSVFATGSGVNPNAFCGWNNLTGAAATVSEGARCCSIPGR